jgi:PKD repeat protein
VSVEVNKPVPFSIKGKDILSSEWSFGESGKTDSRETSPTYTYQEPGTYTVTLIVNGRNDAFVTHLIR